MKLNSFCVVVKKYGFVVHHEPPAKYADAKKIYNRLVNKYINGIEQPQTTEKLQDFQMIYQRADDGTSCSIPVFNFNKNKPEDIMYSDEWTAKKLKEWHGNYSFIFQMFQCGFLSAGAGWDKIEVTLLHSSKA